MFLLQSGPRFHLIQSQRDGRGSVRQRRIWRFEGVQDLREHLEESAWKALQQQVRSAFPELEPDWDKLRERAEVAVQQGSTTERRPASLEAEQDPRVLRQARRERAEVAVQQGSTTERRPASLEAEQDPRVLRQARRERAEVAVQQGSTTERRPASLEAEQDPRVLRQARRERAGVAVQQGSTTVRRPKVLQTGQKLAASLEAEQDPRVLRQARRELTRLCARLDQRLRSLEKAPQRLERARELAETGELTRAERLLRKVPPQAEALEALADVLERQDRREEALDLRARRVALRPNLTGRLDLGAALHRCGKLGEALEQYRQIPASQAARYYHEGAAWLQAGNPEAALVPLMRALARDSQVARALKSGRDLDYWSRFGDLWTAEAREFLLSLAADPLVANCLGSSGRQGSRIRWLVPRRCHSLLLTRVLARRGRRCKSEPFEPKYGQFPIRPRRDRPQPMTYRRMKFLERNPWYKDLVLPPPRPPKRKHPLTRKRLREQARAAAQASAEPPTLRWRRRERPRRRHPRGC